ncbi:MAG: biotin transporter BioY [Puniceicoccales bacterium]|jgi:biotin transport system substrate-specific component|nr:biotin transporter BioY [Puniceicoccales bacterium]
MEKNRHSKIVAINTEITGKIFVVVVISLLIFAATLIKVPFYPVPFTLQTLALPLICFFSSRKRVLQGLALFAVYRILQSGHEFLLTSGYVAGFFPMACILTLKHSGSILKLFGKILAAQIIVLLLGALTLSLFIGPKQAFACGFLFFVPAEILKALIAAGLYNLVPPRFKNFPMER